MKHLFLLIILSLTCASNICNAQTDTTKRKVFSYSIRAGLNISNRLGIDDYHVPEYSWKRSFNIGVTCDFRKSKKFLGRTGIYYTEKGFHFDARCPRTQLNYLEMPLLAVFQLPIGSLVKLEMQTGLFFAYGIGGYEKMWDDYAIPNADGGYDWDANFFYIPSFTDSDLGKAYYKRFDAGINFGLGINVWRCYVGCSYDFSLMYDKKANHCGMIDLGYTF